MISLLEGEKEIMNVAGIVLTNKRVIFLGKGGSISQGYKSMASIATINDIDSVLLTTARNPEFFTMGIIFLILGLLISLLLRNEISLFIIITGIVLIVLYFLTKKAVIVFRAGGTPFIELEIQAFGSTQQLDDLINTFYALKLGIF